MKTILITGINGFLGGNLAKRFSKSYKIVGTEYSLENLTRIAQYGSKVYNADIQTIQKLFSENRIDIIIHTATFYGRSQEEICKVFEANLLLPFYLLDFAIRNKCELFINTDSSLERFTSNYSLTKKQFNDWLYFRSNKIKAVNMQLEHFYGPGANDSNFVINMIRKLLRNEPQIDLTLGEQKRDFVYYEDVLDAYELIINSKNNMDNDFNHYEVGTGELISIKNLMNLLKELTDSSSILNFGAIPYRKNELMQSDVNLGKMLELGWKPKIKIRNGLLKTIQEINK